MKSLIKGPIFGSNDISTENKVANFLIAVCREEVFDVLISRKHYDKVSIMKGHCFIPPNTTIVVTEERPIVRLEREEYTSVVDSSSREEILTRLCEWSSLFRA